MHYFTGAKLKIVLSIFDGCQRISEIKPSCAWHSAQCQMRRLPLDKPLQLWVPQPNHSTGHSSLVRKQGRRMPKTSAAAPSVVNWDFFTVFFCAKWFRSEFCIETCALPSVGEVFCETAFLHQLQSVNDSAQCSFEFITKLSFLHCSFFQQ